MCVHADLFLQIRMSDMLSETDIDHTDGYVDSTDLETTTACDRANTGLHQRLLTAIRPLVGKLELIYHFTDLAYKIQRAHTIIAALTNFQVAS